MRGRSQGNKGIPMNWDLTGKTRDGDTWGPAATSDVAMGLVMEAPAERCRHMTEAVSGVPVC